MAHSLVLRRHETRLIAPDQSWCDLLLELPEKVDLNAKITRARSLNQLGTYWGALDWTIKNGPEWIGQRWLGREEFSDALQIKVGFVRPVASPLSRDVVINVPKSKSFSECSQEAFNAYFDRVQDVLTEWCGYNPVEMYLKHMAERSSGDRHGVQWSDRVPE